jgi:Glu-tRNA(Gln) amidotransferase subunit E-like FAD-binding protein
MKEKYLGQMKILLLPELEFFLICGKKFFKANKDEFFLMKLYSKFKKYNSENLLSELQKENCNSDLDVLEKICFKNLDTDSIKHFSKNIEEKEKTILEFLKGEIK